MDLNPENIYTCACVCPFEQECERALERVYENSAYVVMAHNEGD